MVALKRSLTYDQPLSEITYANLFEENRDGDQGRFAETLRDQHLYELMQTYPAIESSIRCAPVVSSVFAARAARRCLRPAIVPITSHLDARPQ